MALSASLFLRQNQSLVMTPQLMQSIQLLQMTHLELNQFIAQEIEKNPLLELSSAEQSEAFDAVPSSDSDRHDADNDKDIPAEGTPGDDWYEPEAHRTAERLGELDARFDNLFQDDRPPPKADAPELLSQWKSMPGAERGEDYDIEDFVAGHVTLRDHLARQVPFLLTDTSDRIIAHQLLDCVDEAGYFGGEIDDIASSLGQDRSKVELVLQALQTLDPPGVMATSLRECLAIQLKLLDRLDPAMEMLVHNLDLLARRDFASLRKLCGVGDEDLLDMLTEIRSLNPKPGSGFEHSACETVSPDVVISSRSGTWIVELNPDTLPRVLVNREYLQTVSSVRARQKEDQAFLSDCLQSANWLTRSLDQRARTILRVATEIVRQQDAFLTHGIEHLRPLNLKTVAEAIKMHESTVSRVTTNKYMLTPRGLFELKYFFSVSIGPTDDGGDTHSAEAVRHRIRTLISEESAGSVLSDDDIVSSLRKEGINLARRTVAKYREAMNIPSSVQRRREKRAVAKLSTV